MHKHSLTGGLVRAALVACSVAAIAMATMASASTGHGSVQIEQFSNFRATVYRGPDAGLSLTGRITLDVGPTGRFSGSLHRNHGATLPVSGQITGAAINAIFYLGSEKHIFAEGTFGKDPDRPHVFVGGALVGPGPGDSGDWQAFNWYCDDHPDAEGCPGEQSKK